MQKSKVKLLLGGDPNEKGDKENINTNDERHENIVVSEVRKKSLKDVPNGTEKLIDCGTKYDTRKRYSIGNGELRVNGKTREVSPTARLAQNRKLSADMRLRSGAYNVSDEYVSRRPVRLKCMMNNLEVYDTLHTKAGNVSILTINTSVRFTLHGIESLFNVISSEPDSAWISREPERFPEKIAHCTTSSSCSCCRLDSQYDQ